jgi:nucleoside-diphosphate-sugar epimerase
MSLNVLVTGAYGTIGRHVLRELSGAATACALRPALPCGRRDAAGIAGAEPCWGDVRVKADLERAVEGVDAVAHLAFVLPPRTETDPAATWAVNVQGSLNLFEALKARRPEARVALASSYALFGDTRALDGLVTAETPVSLTSHYNRHKAEAEERLRGSGLRWTILRLGVVLSAESAFRTKLDPSLTSTCPRTASRGVRALRRRGDGLRALLRGGGGLGKVLLIGGGPTGSCAKPHCLNRSRGALGLAPLPAEDFRPRGAAGGAGWTPRMPAAARLPS